jgi:hypothetical protein
VAPSKIDRDMFRQAVAYFAAQEAGYTTGQVLVVSGGY